ncbi:hypothetical protein LAZ67_1001135 [Cordylochernes scorpioides]|uniref:Solute carrier organic anion transporter family member n=1 Tax=Cordylochernes scorpioides TaxID=51811 RepID=A0ABY6JWJ1_9ARAC|nr:hypothetical protein LAZ67_1001135 [Cordylochernes scorpioides]
MESVANGMDVVVANGGCCRHRPDTSTVCGLCSFRPRWLQLFANKQSFLTVFCATSVLQGMYYTYFVSVLTTIEKLYQIQSKTTGFIMSATEIGQIGGALLLTYYGGQGHRPKWISCGMLVFAFASILCSMPHFIFGGPPGAVGGRNLTRVRIEELESHMCFANETSVPSVSLLPLLPDDVPLTVPHRCESPKEIHRHKTVTTVVLAVFFVSLLFIGIGATAVYTLGIPYIDDNVATRESPLYFGKYRLCRSDNSSESHRCPGITIGVRIFGPVFGFMLGSVCTSVYVNFPFGNQGWKPEDPQWIGAWWLGVFIVGTALVFTSFPMMAFPRILPQKGGKIPPTARKSTKRPRLKDFPAAMRRLLRNKVLLFRTASSVLHILPIAGLYTFLPKYLESQFQLSADKANMIAGIAGILVMGVGIFASGSFMRKFKPTARVVARWITLATLAYSLGMGALMWVGCPLGDFVGLNAGNDELVNLPTCNRTCGCRPGEFFPVCTGSGVTYLSPCLAGCQRLAPVGLQTGLDRPDFNFTDCRCLPEGETARPGLCPLDCGNNLVLYTLLFSVFVLIHSTSEVGSMLLTLRCVDPQDKAMALGLISFAIGLFGNVPCPVIYGAVVDSACLFWEDNCGERGACRVYDPHKFRLVFHGLTAAIMFAAFLVDAVIWYRADAIPFNEEPPSLEEKEPMKPPLPPPNVESCI